MTKLLLPMTMIGLMVWWSFGAPIVQKRLRGEATTDKEHIVLFVSLLFLAIGSFGALGATIGVVLIFLGVI